MTDNKFEAEAYKIRLRKRLDGFEDLWKYISRCGMIEGPGVPGWIPRAQAEMCRIGNILEGLIKTYHPDVYPFHIRRTWDKVWYLGRGHKVQYMIDESELWYGKSYPASWYRVQPTRESA